MLPAEPCTRLPWNISMPPPLPVGATMPPSFTSRVTVSSSSVHSGYDVVSRSCEALWSPACWLFGTSIRGPLIGITSSRKIAMFMARGNCMPSSRFQVPLPDVAGEGGFCVDLVLVHVDLFAEDLLHRIDHARVGAEQPERLVVEMGGKGGARRAALLAPYLGALGVVDALRLARQQRHFLGAEQFRQEQPALAVEVVDLLLGQFHGIPPHSIFSRFAGSLPQPALQVAAFLNLEFAAQLLQRCVDPGAVHGTSSLQFRQRLVLRLLLGGCGLVDLLDLIEGNAEQAVGVPDDEVAGLDHHAIDCDGPADFAGPGFIGTAVGDAGGIDRKTQAAQRIGVPDRAVDDDACDLAIDGVADHDFADDRIGQVAAGIDHDDVAGRGDIECLVHHQIVAGARLHRESRAGKDAAGVIGPQPRTAAGQARHAIADVGDRQWLELLNVVRADAPGDGLYRKSDHCDFFPRFASRLNTRLALPSKILVLSAADSGSWSM